MANKPSGVIHPKATYILGVDLARLGQDSSVFLVLEKPFDSDEIYVVFIKEMETNLMNEAVNYIKFLDKRFHFTKIYMDTTGLGSGPYDFLIVDQSFKYRTEDCTFNKSLDGKPLKEIAYTNMKMLLERKSRGVKGGLHLPDNKKLLYQLIDLRYELKTNGGLKIHHSERGHDDYPDALAIACLYFRPTNQVDMSGSFAIG